MSQASRFVLVCVFCLNIQAQSGTHPSTPYGTSYQINVNARGENIVGDAANEPSLCIDPNDPNRMAVGWRQFNTVTNDFRQAGYAYSTNGGLNWALGGVLETNVFRSDPVLATDADGRFYYLSLMPTPDFHCDLWQSVNGGQNWQKLADAYGGDKAWMTIDVTTSSGRGNIYQSWSHFFPASNNIFTRSTDGGRTWMSPIPVPRLPYWGTLDVGPNGELYLVGTDGNGFWLNRSTNAADRTASPGFDLTTPVNLNGKMVYSPAINPVGLLGQPWVAVDRSDGPTRGNIYVLCSVGTTSSAADVMFSRSTDGGANWSAPQRINDDAPGSNVWHWFGTLSVAPNGRIDACWNDTRNSRNASLSELYYSWSTDGGLTWAPNRPLSPPFNQSLGYPTQEKMGDYIAMVSLNDAACIVYTATFNGEEDLYFVRAELPIAAGIVRLPNAIRITWNAVPGANYSVQFKDNLIAPWTNMLGSLVAVGSMATLDDRSADSQQRFYRVIRSP